MQSAPLTRFGPLLIRNILLGILFLFGIGLLFSSQPKVTLPAQGLAPGANTAEIQGNRAGFFFHHRLEGALESPQLSEFEILITSQLGHFKPSADGRFAVPVYFRDRAQIQVAGPATASLKLGQAELRRRPLLGTWVILSLLGAGISFFHVLSRPGLSRLRYAQLALLGGSAVGAFVLSAVFAQFFAPRVRAQEWHLFPPHLDQTFHVLPELTPGIPEGIVRFKTNSEGIRAGERWEPWDEVNSVLCLGASTTEGLFLGEENHWPRLLEKRLRKAKGTNVWVGNAGRSGLPTSRLVRVAEVYIERIRPKFVVLLTGFNEGLAPDDASAHYPEPKKGVRGGLSKLANRVAIYRLLRSTLFSHEVSSPNDVDFSGSTAAYAVARRKLREQPKRERAWEDLDLSTFADSLRRVHSMCREVEATLILCTQPTIYRDDLTPEEEDLLWMMGDYTPASKRARMDLVNDQLRRVAHELGVTLVDLDKELPRSTEVFYDDCHFNLRGAQMVAESVYQALDGQL